MFPENNFITKCVVLMDRNGLIGKLFFLDIRLQVYSFQDLYY